MAGNAVLNVDFNELVRGSLRAPFEDAPSVREGDSVIVVDDDAELRASATVERIDADAGLLHLVVDESTIEEIGSSAPVGLTVAAEASQSVVIGNHFTTAARSSFQIPQRVA